MTLPLFLTARPMRIALMASVLILAAAYGFEAAGYAPCKLCWYQRYPYMAVILVAGAALALRADRRATLLLVVAGLFELTGWIGFFHAGVEYGWWPGPESCTGLPDTAGDADAFLRRIEGAAVIRCDAASWSLFGVSMAGYNFILAMVLAVYMAVFGFRQLGRDDDLS